MRARSRGTVLRKVWNAVNAWEIACPTSARVSSGRVPILASVAGSVNELDWYFRYSIVDERKSTEYIECLPGFRIDPFAVDIRLLAEERGIIKLNRG